MRTDNLGRALGTVDAHAHAIGVRCEGNTGRIGANLDALFDQESADRLRNFWVLTPDQAWPHLDHRDLGTKTAKYLREFKADIAAADDHEMPGKIGEIEDRDVGQIVDLIEAGHRRCV